MSAPWFMITPMTEETVQFNSELFVWGEGGWYFVRLPAEAAEDVRDQVTGPRRGFGSVRVRVQIGDSIWSTSVFPEKAGSFLLPVKKAVRRSESLLDGDPVEVELTVLP